MKVPKPPALVTGVKALGALSTSVAVSVPVAVVPGVALATPPASIAAPVVAPEMMAASLVPWMVIVTSWGCRPRSSP